MTEVVLRELWVYPVKSCRGIRLDEADVVTRGLAHDRRFMVVDANGRFLTQRERPELARFGATLEGDALVLEGPSGARARARHDGPPVTASIWGEAVAARDAGDEVAAVLRADLGADARLVYMPDDTRRPADPDYAGPDDLVSFADAFPFLLVGVASLDALNARLASPVDMRRFRPNLVVDGAPAFAEDTWSALSVGPIRLRSPKPCSRCAIVDVDPARGERDLAVLPELGRFRRDGRHVNFGVNFVHEGRGRLAVGARVEVT